MSWFKRKRKESKTTEIKLTKRSENLQNQVVELEQNLEKTRTKARIELGFNFSKD